MMLQPIRMLLQLEPLEVRENPTTGIVESFDQSAVAALPSGWSEWSNDGTTVFGVAAGTGASGSASLVSSAGSRTSGIAWDGTAVAGDTGVAASVDLTTLVPTFLFARGSNLSSASPTYLEATITRGVSVSISEVVNGTPHVLASLTSPASSYFSANWVQVVLTPTGNSVAVQVIRQDTGQYLNTKGTWQTAATTALTATTTLPSANGLVGVGRAAAYSGPVSLDNFTVLPPAQSAAAAPTSVTQSFDSLAAGAKPADWSGWSTDASSAFAASPALAESPTNGFASAGGSTSADRAWANLVLPADVTASA
ncbi:MAG TPA: hypothetical protein VGL71_14905, partial [Urbifossiella sp.]